VTIARFALYPLIVGALVTSTAAHATPPKAIIDSWQENMIRSVENLPPERRESYMMKLTTDAKKDLDQVTCVKEQDAQETVALVKKAVENINKAIARFSVTMRYGYIPRCDAPNAKNERRLKVDFVFGGIDKVTGGVHEFDKSLVDRRILEMMIALKDWTHPKNAALTKDRQAGAFADLIHTHTQRLGAFPCSPDPSDRLFAYVKGQLQESMRIAHEYIDTRKIEVECRGNRLAITLEAYPIVSVGGSVQYVDPNAKIRANANTPPYPEAEQHAANLDKIKHAIEVWGDMAKKAINETHEAKKTKVEVDAATIAAAKVISTVACLRTSEADLQDLVAKEVKKRSFDMDVNASGECDQQKHTWTVNFTVAAVRIPYDAAKDGKGVNFSQGVAADLIIDEFFTKAKTFIDPKTVGWQKLIEQTPAFKEKVAGYVGQLNKITCGPSDKVAEYVQSEITKKASSATAYIKINSVRAACSSGHLAVALDADPVHP